MRDIAQPARIVYLAPSDIQVARVDRQCIVNFCDALSGIGLDVELVAIGIRVMEGETTARNPLELYRIRRPFPVRIVSMPVGQTSPDWWISLNRLLVHAWRGLVETIAARRRRPTVIYTKNYGPALVLLALRRMRRNSVRIAFEPHLPPKTRLHAAILRRCDYVVANTERLAADLVAEHGIDPAKTLGTHQGVDLEMYDQQRVDAVDARRRLGLEERGHLVVYTGKVAFGYSEVEYILEAARKLRRRSDIRFLIVGGRHDHVALYRELVDREGLTSVTFAGFVVPVDVQLYQFAADVLVLYYPSGIAINRYRSPGKLFEYMAAGRAIVSVDLPVLREVLGEVEPAAVMVAQDDPTVLAGAIEELIDDPERRARLAVRSLEAVAAFSWRARARRIVNFFNKAARSAAPDADVKTSE